MSVAQQVDETVGVHDAMWSQRVMLISDKLHRQFPEELHGRVEAAMALALDPRKVQRDADGGWHVAASKGGWYSVNGSCGCPDFPRAMGNWCAHRLAATMVHRAHEIPEEDLVLDPATHDPQTGEIVAQSLVAGSAREADEDAPEQRYQLPAHFFTTIQGVKCIRYTGLVQLARAEGLLSLKAEWTHNEEQLSLARAVALFQDGRRFVECGDSTPTNAARVKDAWRRMSLTRAKARCLRDALSVDLCSVEEME